MFAFDLTSLTYPMILLRYFEFNQRSFVLAQVIIQHCPLFWQDLSLPFLFFTMTKFDGSRSVQLFQWLFLVTELLSITNYRQWLEAWCTTTFPHGWRSSPMFPRLAPSKSSPMNLVSSYLWTIASEDGT
jgi:hypothetical protein